MISRTLLLAQVLMSLVNPTNTVTVDLEAVTFATFRTEFRLEHLTVQPEVRYIWGLGAFPQYFCRIPANELRIVCQFQPEASPQGTADADLTGRAMDVRVRWQRDPVKGLMRMEIWDGICQQYVAESKPITNLNPPKVYTGPMKLADQMQIAFLRMYSTLDDSGDCPLDAPESVTWDILDWRGEDEPQPSAVPSVGVVSTALVTCRWVLSSLPPDSSTGWGVQFLRDDLNAGSRDVSPPFTRVLTGIPAGTHRVTAVWTKADGTRVTAPVAEKTCP